MALRTARGLVSGRAWYRSAMTRPVRRSPPRAVIALLICRAGGDREALDPLGERALAVGLDDEVDMVALDGHVDDAEVLAPGGDDRRLAQREVDVAAAQPGGTADDPHRHVHRMSSVVLGPRCVGRTWALALRLAPRARALAAVGPEDHLDLPALPSRSAHGSWLPDRATA
jgi:hypothetical protein